MITEDNAYADDTEQEKVRQVELGYVNRTDFGILDER